MPGIVEFMKLGPITYPVGATITGGQLVMPGSGGTAGKVIVATDNALTCLGLALTDAAVEPTIPTAPSVTIDVHIPRGHVAVAHIGVFRLVATGAIAFGDFVGCAANGTVKTIAAAGGAYSQTEVNANTRGIIGQCVEPGGIANTVAGKIRLMLA
jgi:hypothetical protein